MKTVRTILFLTIFAEAACILQAQEENKPDILKGNSTIPFLTTNKTYFDYLNARNNLLDKRITLKDDITQQEKQPPSQADIKRVNITLNPKYTPRWQSGSHPEPKHSDFIDKVFYKAAGEVFKANVNSKYRNVNK
jgi:hypothetical protein